MPPLVSIILPTYNGQRYLAESIESCLNQTYKNIELIIVDDSSTDETPSIIKHYGEIDPRIKIITNLVNQKLPRSLNIGHKASSGDFLTWTSDDNIYLPQAIERMVSFLSENAEIGMVYCDFDCVNEQKEFTKKVTVGERESLISYNCIGACFLYRRTVFSTIGFYSHKFLYAEDFDYWLRVAAKFDISPLHETLYQYRLHDSSLTSATKKEKILDVTDQVIRNHFSHFPWISKNQRFLIGKQMAKKAIRNRGIVAFMSSTWIWFFSNPKQFFFDFSKWLVRKIKGK